MTLHIGIIGTGIGGLTATLACRQAGYDVEVFEASDCGAMDGIVQLPPNATRLLRALKVLDEIAALAVRPESIHFRSWKSGYLIASRPLGAFAEDRYGAPFLHVLHRQLLNTLRAELSRRDITLHAHTSTASIQEDGLATLQWDGHIHRFDALILCDGARSTTRQWLFGDNAAQFSGRIEWQALVPGDLETSGRARYATTRWLGPRGHFAHHDVDGGRQIGLTGIVENSPAGAGETPGSGEWLSHAGVDAFRQAFDGWHPRVTGLIGRATACRSRAVFECAPLPTWSRGRVVLLGNACHPMAPYHDQGCAMAIEDAWILSRLLVDWEDDDLTAALNEYERYRQPRISRTQRAALDDARSYHEPDSLRAFTRNLKLALGTRLLPEFAIEKFDWLYGYDAVKGFD